MKARVNWQPTKKQQNIMNDEIRKQLAAQNEQYGIDVDSLILWLLHDKYGFGKKRLRDVYTGLAALWGELTKFYEIPNANPWICREKLKHIGVDIEQWAKDVCIPIGGANDNDK